MSNQNELDLYKRNIKEKIFDYISNNELTNAKELIVHYEKIIPNDVEIYHSKAIINIQEEKYEDAEKILKEAIHMDNENTDTYYNLGYLYELKNNIEDSYKYYNLAIRKCLDINLQEEIELKLKDFEENYPNLGTLTYNTISLKKVLVIAHIFPPIGGSGVQRTLKFVKFLRENGWEPTVVTVGNSKYPLVDTHLLSEIPEDIKILRVDEPIEIKDQDVNEVINLYNQIIDNPELMEEFLTEAQKNNKLLFLPDGLIYWANSVLKMIEKQININDFDMIYSTSGPYTDHIIGYFIKQSSYKPWVADFRDEWTNNSYSNFDSNSLSYRMQVAMEKNIVKTADKVITVTPISTRNYIESFGISEKKVQTILNGFDEEDFNELNLLANKDNDKFTIVHNGLFYSIRSPKTFLQAISNLIKNEKIDKDKVSILFTWSENQESWLNYIKENGLEEIVKIQGYLNHKESLQMATLADLLLLVVGSGEKNKAVYTGKIFEYLRLCKPILSLSPDNSLVENLIKSLNRGYNSDFDDVEKIERYILEEYNKWLKEPGLLTLDDNIRKYDRRELTKELTSVFNEVLDSKNRLKVAFFSIKSGDNFLNDIIKDLEETYEVRKFIITNLSQIETAMEWADICWFEWCDQLVEYGSKLEIAKRKKIICRLHRYEAFTKNPGLVNWEVVDKLIFVSKHIKENVNMKLNLPDEKIIVIPNGINQKKFIFKERKRGYNLAVLGHINLRKNPMMILQHFKALVELDPNYKLYFAGGFSGDVENGTLEYYMKYIVEKLNLENNVFFDGYIDNSVLADWLDDKNYIITGSIGEGHPVGIMESMSCGLKPVIHTYPGIEDHYPNKYYYYDVQGFIKIITEKEYDSYEYSQYISDNYSLDLQMKKIKDVIGFMEKTIENQKILLEGKREIQNKSTIETKDVEEFYDDFLEYLKKDRINPNKRHEYIKSRLKQIVKQGDKVLDLGCGIGITTEYISTLNVSKVIGVDLSSKLIDYARKTVTNVEFLVNDITKIELGEKFDVISLCDVVEHIPRECYSDLFKAIKKHLKDNGQVFITIPDPEYNDFLREHKPEKMQIIDNSVTFKEINGYCEINGLKVKYFNVYGIWLPNEYNEYILNNNNIARISWRNFHL